MVAALLLFALGLVCLVGVLNAYRPARAWFLVIPSWAAASVVVEVTPHLIVFSGVIAALLVVLGATSHALGVAGVAMLALADLLALRWVWRSSRTTVSIRGVVDELDPDPDTPRFPRLHVAFPFLMFSRRGVRHERGVVYARRGSYPLKLDVYMPDRPAEELRPAIVHVHGGGWIGGTRKEQGIPLLNHLAANGWVGFNVNYRLSPLATWPDHAVDVKEAIAWVREHAADYGVDPSFVAITGGSAGGHISAFVALTADDRSLQPGFEDADVSVAAAVPFYGVYDMLDAENRQMPITHRVTERVVFKRFRADDPEAFRAASPIFRITADAPPFFVIHGDRDSLVPVAEARRFAETLRETSNEPVLYAEMKGGQHAFDIVPSLRTAPVIEAVERFLHTVHTRREAPAAEVEREAEAALT